MKSSSVTIQMQKATEQYLPVVLVYNVVRSGSDF